MFCQKSELKNESDVEQKLVFQILSTSAPLGLGYDSSEIYTKESIQCQSIGKGDTAKTYRPDYIIYILGLPAIVIEAKRPGESIDTGLQEARLYAAILNAKYPAGVCPVRRVVCCNGDVLATSAWDTETADCTVTFEDIAVSSASYNRFVEILNKSTIRIPLGKISSRLRPNKFARPLDLIGGYTVQNEMLEQNVVGKEFAQEFEHIFNPQSPQERAHIARNAYVASKRRSQYADEIERLVHRAVPKRMKVGNLIRDSSKPHNLQSLLGRGRDLQNKILILVGPAGSGKTTFVDYFRVVRIPQEVKDGSLWIHINMNNAPKQRDLREDWIVSEIARGLKNSEPETDFDSAEVVDKVYGVELLRFKKRTLGRLPENDLVRMRLIAEEITRLDSDKIASTTALSRYLVGDRQKLLVVVLDNSDKGDKTSQLDLFESVHWLQEWLTCMVFLPLRDITYDLYRNTPPLDTVISDYVFRIEPPRFADVLDRRIKLSLSELQLTGSAKLRTFTLDNSEIVSYSPEYIERYVRCLYKAIFEEGGIFKRTFVGLADKNIRNALNLFVETCKSGHITSALVWKIQTEDGNYSLPHELVTRAVMRGHRRYYDGEVSMVKNVFQVKPESSTPINATRYLILRWLDIMLKIKGPSGVLGFHRCESAVKELASFGIETDLLEEEICYLVSVGCIVTEHQTKEPPRPGDLLKLSGSGLTHLRLARKEQYLAACAEDSQISDLKLAQEIAEKLGNAGGRKLYSAPLQAELAGAFGGYVLKAAESLLTMNDVLHQPEGVDPIGELRSIAEAAERARRKRLEKVRSSRDVSGIEVGAEFNGRVSGIKEYGIFVTIRPRCTGLLHVSALPAGRSVGSFVVGSEVQVLVASINTVEGRVSLRLKS